MTIVSGGVSAVVSGLLLGTVSVVSLLVFAFGLGDQSPVLQVSLVACAFFQLLWSTRCVCLITPTTLLRSPTFGRPVVRMRAASMAVRLDSNVVGVETGAETFASLVIPLAIWDTRSSWEAAVDMALQRIDGALR